MTLTPRQRQLMTLFCVSTPSFMLQLDANVVSVSLPAIARSLRANFAGIEWVITAYTLSFAALLMPSGALADRFGRKEVLMTGLGIFTLASLFCGLAPSLPILVAARAFQGIGAALQISSALAMLSHSFQGEARSRAFAIWGSVIGIGIASGPIIGGLITQWFGWRWAFYVNVPIGLPLIALIAKFEDSSRDPQASRLDIPGVASFAAFLFLTTLALITGNAEGWASPVIVAEAGSAILFLALFVIVEYRQPRPMLELGHLRRPSLQGASIAQMVFAAGLLTMLTYVPIYFQSALGYGPAAAGLLMIPMVLPMFLMPSIASRHLAHRFSGRALLTIGLLLDAAGLAWRAATATSLHYGAMIGGMVLAGCGAGLLTSETAKVSMTLMPADRAGMASGLSTTTRFSGLVIGFALLGAVHYGRISSFAAKVLPELDPARHAAFVKAVAAGDFTGGDAWPDFYRFLARDSFVAGNQALFLAAALASLVAALLTWKLVRSDETAPSARPAPADEARLLVEA